MLCGNILNGCYQDEELLCPTGMYCVNNHCQQQLGGLGDHCGTTGDCVRGLDCLSQTGSTTKRCERRGRITGNRNNTTLNNIR